MQVETPLEIRPLVAGGSVSLEGKNNEMKDKGVSNSNNDKDAVGIIMKMYLFAGVFESEFFRSSFVSMSLLLILVFIDEGL